MSIDEDGQKEYSHVIRCPKDRRQQPGGDWVHEPSERLEPEIQQRRIERGVRVEENPAEDTRLEGSAILAPDSLDARIEL